MRSIHSILTEIADCSSPKMKRKMLLENDSNDLRLVISAALNPYLPYFLRAVPVVLSKIKLSTISWQRVVDDFLTPLSNRTLSGKEALRQADFILNKLSADDGVILRCILKKDLRCGVGSKIANSTWPGLVPEFKVQLAVKDSSKAVFPCRAEPKRDGMRVLSFVGEDAVYFMSRGGRLVETMELIGKKLVKVCPPGFVLDGEASSGVSFEASLSGVKRGSAQDDKPVTYTIFDMIKIEEFNSSVCNTPLFMRLKGLDRIADALDLEGMTSRVAVVESRIVQNKADAKAYHDECVDRGFEGIMLKDMRGTYDFKRTNSWVKMKNSETEDLIITGYKEGRKKYVNMLGAIVVDRNGVACRVGTGFSDKERKVLWKNKDRLVGMTAEVRFMRATVKGKTREPRFVKFREHDGERS